MRRDPRHILILGSRRSGTTAFWRLFRQLPAYRALDEPFNPVLRKLPRENVAGTRSELIGLFNADPEAFRRRFSPIAPHEETAPGMSDAQRDYLAWLLSHGPTVVDTTRCLAKVGDLHAVASEAVLVHLFRRPMAFVTSHLVPSGRRGPFGVRAAVRRLSFFLRRSGFNKWGLEDLLAGQHRDQTSRLLHDERVRGPEEGTKAVGLLLRYWLASFRRIEREGRRRFGRRYFSLAFESFCREPEPHLGEILRAADHGPWPIDLSALRRPGPGHRERHPRWRSLARGAGFTPLEVARFFS